MSFTGKSTYGAGSSLPEIAEDVSDLVAIASPHETALLDALGDAPRAAHSTIHEWLEDELLPNTDRVNDNSFSSPTADTTFGVDNASRRGIDHERTDADSLAVALTRRRPVGSAEERPHACDELAGAERLHHVVVAADREANLEIRLAVAGGEHEDRHTPVALDLPAHAETVEARKHQVEHDEIGAEAAAEVDALDAVAGRFDLESL